MPVPLGPSRLQSTSAQAACVEVKFPHAWSIFSDVATCWGSTEGMPCPGALSGAGGQRPHAVGPQPTPYTDLQCPLLEEEPGTAELSEQ